MVKLRPRSIELAELIELLGREHVDFSGRMVRVMEGISHADYKVALSELATIKEDIYQHILDEESSVLALLIRKLGRSGAAEAIEIFQEHVDIQDMIGRLEQHLSSGDTSIEELGASLDSFMKEHFRKEDEKVFPTALKAGSTAAVSV